MTIPGSTFDRECSECRRRVMLSPQGQKVLDAQPSIELICLPCAERLYPDDLANGQPAAGTVREFMEGVSSAVPNVRRHRN